MTSTVGILRREIAQGARTGKVSECRYTDATSYPTHHEIRVAICFCCGENESAELNYSIGITERVVE